MSKSSEQFNPKSSHREPAEELKKFHQENPEQVRNNIEEEKERSEYKSSDENTKKEVSEKSLEEKFLNKTLEFLKHNPNINFIVYGTGNITGKERYTIGAYGYIFDQEKQKMEGCNEIDFLDIRPNAKSTLFEGNVKYDPGNLWSYVTVQFPFRCIESNNNYMTDARAGSYITLAVRFKKSLDDEMIKRLTEGENFIGELVQRAAREFIPEYWNFVERQYDLYVKEYGGNKQD